MSKRLPAVRFYNPQANPNAKPGDTETQVYGRQ